MTKTRYKKLTGKSLEQWAKEQNSTRNAVHSRWKRWILSADDRDKFFAKMKETGKDITYLKCPQDARRRSTYYNRRIDRWMPRKKVAL